MKQIRKGDVTIVELIKYVRTKCIEKDDKCVRVYLALGSSGQSYEHFTLANYNSRVVIWGI